MVVRFLNVRNKHEWYLDEWMARGKKALNQGLGNLQAFYGGMHSLVSNIVNGRWQQRTPIFGSAALGKVEMAMQDIKCVIIYLIHKVYFGSF